MRRRLQVEGGTGRRGGRQWELLGNYVYLLSPVVVVVCCVCCVVCVWCVRRRCNAFNKQDDVALDDDCSARGLLCSALAAALEPPLIPLPPHTPPLLASGTCSPDATTATSPIMNPILCGRILRLALWPQQQHEQEQQQAHLQR